MTWLRRTQPALHRGSTNSYHLDASNRVHACHRWVPGDGRTVVIVMSQSESTLYGYSLGFPATEIPWHTLRPCIDCPIPRPSPFRPTQYLSSHKQEMRDIQPRADWDYRKATVLGRTEFNAQVRNTA
ncbi:hypothetical protein [Arthrobacter sp. D1-17]